MVPSVAWRHVYPNPGMLLEKSQGEISIPS